MACTLNLFVGSYSHMDLLTCHSMQQVSPERIKLSYESTVVKKDLKENRHGNYLEISGRAIANMEED